MFQRGTDFFSIFLKYLVRENCFGWNQLLRDRSRTGQTGILIFGDRNLTFAPKVTISEFLNI